MGDIVEFLRRPPEADTDPIILDGKFRNSEFQFITMRGRLGERLGENRPQRGLVISLFCFISVRKITDIVDGRIFSIKIIDLKGERLLQVNVVLVEHVGLGQQFLLVGGYGTGGDDDQDRRGSGNDQRGSHGMTFISLLGRMPQALAVFLVTLGPEEALRDDIRILTVIVIVFQNRHQRQDPVKRIVQKVRRLT